MSVRSPAAGHERRLMCSARHLMTARRWSMALIQEAIQGCVCDLVGLVVGERLSAADQAPHHRTEQYVHGNVGIDVIAGFASCDGAVPELLYAVLAADVQSFAEPVRGGWVLHGVGQELGKDAA